MSDDKFRQSRGVAYFAKLNYQNPDKGYEGNRPNLQLCLVPDNPDEFTSAGVKLKDATDKIPGAHAKITTKFVDQPLKVTDSKGNRLPHDFIIGNGSEVMVQWSPFDYKKGISATLNGVAVITHVPYEPESLIDEEGGFEFTPASDASSASEGASANDGL